MPAPPPSSPRKICPNFTSWPRLNGSSPNPSPAPTITEIFRDPDRPMKMRLMIVDDHDGMRSAIKALIAAPGDIVLECSNGDEAIEALADFKPDCVTVDIHMPGRCAFE